MQPTGGYPSRQTATHPDEMARVSTTVLIPALATCTSHLAIDLLTRLRAKGAQSVPAKATRPFLRRRASQIYREKAARGDRPTVRTEGFPELLASLQAVPSAQVIVHGITFADAVYLVFTDATRTECIGVLRKRRLDRELDERGGT